MTDRKVYLFSQIDEGNLLLAWLLSLFVSVQTLRFKKLSLKRLPTGIKLFKFGEWADWQDLCRWQDMAASGWMHHRSSLKRAVIMRGGGTSTDFTVKQRQLLAGYYERRFLIDRINCARSNSIVWIEDQHSWMLRAGREEKPLGLGTVIGLLNSPATGGWEMFLLFVGIYRLIRRCFLLCCRKSPIDRHESLVLWDAVNPNEFYAGAERRHFYWINDHITSNNASGLYILPTPPDEELAASLPDDVRWVTADKILSFVERRDVSDILTAALEAFIVSAPAILCTWRGRQSFLWFLESLPWRFFVRRHKVLAYVVGSSSAGHEPSAISVMNEMNVKTCLYNYGTNHQKFASAEEHGHRNIIFCDLAARFIHTWNQHQSRYFISHGISPERILNIGPLMPGKESLSLAQKEQFLSEFNRKNHKLLCAFDIPPVSDAYDGTDSMYPDQNTIAYNAAFLRDVVRLLDDFPEIIIVYKPKRSLRSGKFDYQSEVLELLEKCRADGRLIILDDAINPWVPPSLADISVGMPFTSPVLVSLNREIPSFFHDPLGLAHCHNYRALDDHITHSYEELRSCIRKALNYPNEGTSRNAPFLFPNSSDEYSAYFAEFICGKR